MILWKCYKNAPCGSEAMCRKSFQEIVEKLTPQELLIADNITTEALCQDMEAYTTVRIVLELPDGPERIERLATIIANCMNDIFYMRNQMLTLSEAVGSLLDDRRNRKIEVVH